MKVEDLIIYKQYVELIYYTHQILLKYPKIERYSLVDDIKKQTYSGLEKIILTYKAYKPEQKAIYLTQMDVSMKVLKVMIRISYKNKYISSKNYSAWSKKIANICNLMGGWMKSCRKQ